MKQLLIIISLFYLAGCVEIFKGELIEDDLSNNKKISSSSSQLDTVEIIKIDTIQIIDTFLNTQLDTLFNFDTLFQLDSFIQIDTFLNIQIDTIVIYSSSSNDSPFSSFQSVVSSSSSEIKYSSSLIYELDFNPFDFRIYEIPNSDSFNTDSGEIKYYQESILIYSKTYDGSAIIWKIYNNEKLFYHFITVDECQNKICEAPFLSFYDEHEILKYSFDFTFPDTHLKLIEYYNYPLGSLKQVIKYYEYPGMPYEYISYNHSGSKMDWFTWTITGKKIIIN